MTNKDNQEAEREAFAEWFLNDMKPRLTGSSSMLESLTWQAWQARATLTTPQVNEEVVSGAAWTSNDIDDTNCKSDTLEQFCRDNIRLAPFFAMLANRLTPSPSNVLVEALRELVDMCVTQIGADYSDEIHRRYLKGKEALATYSASNDSVSISRSEYEAMNKLAEAARKTLTENSHLTDGDTCTLYDLRDAYKAIDTAKESS